MPDTRTLLELSEEELREALRAHTSRHVVFSYNDVREELNRRAQNRYQRWIAIGTVVYAVLTIGLLAVAILRP